VLRQFIATAAILAQTGICVWVPLYAIRGEFDRELSPKARTIRWTVVLVGWVLASLPGPKPNYLAAIAGIAALAFLWWPNFAYHLTRLIEWAKARGPIQ
jgi:hypothetical protein